MNRVLNNASWMLSGSIANAVIGFVVSIFTVRYLGPLNYGLINYAASLVDVVAPFAKLGFNNVLVSEIINNPNEEGKTIGSTIGFSLITAIICYFGLILFCRIVNPNEEATLVVCSIYSLVIIAESLKLINYWFQAKLLSKYTSITSTIIYIVVSIYKIYLLATGKSVFWFALAQLLDSLLIAIVLFIIFFRKSNQKVSFSFNKGFKVLSRSKYYILSTMMANLLFNMDRIMVKQMIGNESNGYYGAALTISMMTYFVFGAILDSYTPQILEYKSKAQEEQYQKSMINLYSIVIYVFLLQALFVLIFAWPIVRVLYGEAYLRSVPILRVLIISVVINYLGSVRGTWILAENKHKILPLINAVSIVVNFVLNYLLINRYGIIGAAYATLLTYFFSNILTGYIFKSFRGNNELIIKALNPKIFLENIKYITNTLLKRNNQI